jgi:hypothetical protein
MSRLKTREMTTSARLKTHVSNFEKHLKNASDFLVKCQIAEPYVQKGILQGSLCPWEIGVADTSGLTILEDFHDTLEALWVWCYYTRVSNKQTYTPNIEMGWNYIVNNFERHIPPTDENKGLYDCSLVILSGSLYEDTFSNRTHHRWIEDAGNRLAHYLDSISSRTCYSDFWVESCFVWWMAVCLGSAAQLTSNQEWLRIARIFVRHTVIEKEKPFTYVDRESRPVGGIGDHECYSCNASKALAILSCRPSEKVLKETIVGKFLPLIPRGFVKRPVDENPWNANVAMALGKSYLMTGENAFLEEYFSIMDELKKRDIQNSSALPRCEDFSARESWVTFFYAYAYSSIIEDVYSK